MSLMLPQVSKDTYDEFKRLMQQEQSNNKGRVVSAALALASADAGDDAELPMNQPAPSELRIERPAMRQRMYEHAVNAKHALVACSQVMDLAHPYKEGTLTPTREIKNAIREVSRIAFTESTTYCCRQRG